MRVAMVLIGVGVLVGVCGMAGIQPGDKPKEAEKGQPARDMMPDVPGAMQKAFTDRVGKYLIVSRLVVPGSAVIEEKGTAKVSAMLGGRFILVEEKVSMFGQPMESAKVYGYNDRAGKFESVWMYTGSNAIMSLAGTSADQGKTIAYEGGFEVSGSVKESFEISWKDNGADSFTVTLFHRGQGGGGGENGPKMETVFTRVK